jgi:hypothetical protein
MTVLLGQSRWQRSTGNMRRHARSLPLSGSFMDMLSRNIRGATHSTLNVARDIKSLTASSGTGAPDTSVDLSVRSPGSASGSGKILGLPAVGVYAAGGLAALVVLLGVMKRK